MPGYSTRLHDVEIHGDRYRLRVLADRQQYADPDGHAARAGISPEQWPLFGQPWASGERLAEAMHGHAVDGKRVLELGCGIGLASLVLQRRGADIVASDVHPLAGSFLAYNAALNGLPAVHFRQVDWTRHLATLGRFDLIIASDVMYERGQAASLAEAIAGYAYPDAEIVVTDPGRGQAAHFLRAVEVHGFEAANAPQDGPRAANDRSRTLALRRGRAAA